MRRVVVTGAGGFVGAHVAAALRTRGFEVHALGRRRVEGDIAFHAVDLLDRGAVADVLNHVGATHLVHLAWYAEPGLYWRSPANLDWVAATLSLVRSFREAGGARAVAAGTCAEYAWGPERLPEGALCAPATLYGAAKDATRRVLCAYAREAGLSLAWGRMFFLYGPGERPGRLVSDAFARLMASERFGTTHGRQRRDFSHVADIGAAFAQLADSDIVGSINLASGRGVPVRDILEHIGQLTGETEKIDFGARELDADEPANIEADVGRLRSELGFVPRYDLAAGLADTYGWLTRTSPPPPVAEARTIQ